MRSIRWRHHRNFFFFLSFLYRRYLARRPYVAGRLFRVINHSWRQNVVSHALVTHSAAKMFLDFWQPMVNRGRSSRYRNARYRHWNDETTVHETPSVCGTSVTSTICYHCCSCNKGVHSRVTRVQSCNTNANYKKRACAAKISSVLDYLCCFSCKLLKDTNMIASAI